MSDTHLYLPAAVRVYSTAFGLVENPISENASWTSGGVKSTNTDARTTRGLAFGTQTGSNGFDDSLAILTGLWAPNQQVVGIVHTVNQQAGSVYEEIELRLRSTLNASNNLGYECTYSCRNDGSQYAQIVRINPSDPGGFAYVAQNNAAPLLVNGDTLMARITGTLIEFSRNGTVVISGSDSTFAAGNPGIGFYLQGASGINSDFGLTSIVASNR